MATAREAARGGAPELYVAVRCAGKIDVNPIGPMGKIVQLIFAAAAPGETVANLMAAAVACGAAGQAEPDAGLQGWAAHGPVAEATDPELRCYIPAGLLGAVPTYALLRSAHPIGGEQFPAPAAAAWMAVAQALTGGGDDATGLPPRRAAARGGRRVTDRFRADGGSDGEGVPRAYRRRKTSTRVCSSVCFARSRR